MRISATEAKNRFGSFSFYPKREPVFVEKAAGHSASGHHARCKLLEGGGSDIDLEGWYHLARVRSELIWLRHKSSPQAHLGSRLKVIAVCRHHHALMGLDAKRLCSGKIDARLGLVVSSGVWGQILIWLALAMLLTYKMRWEEVMLVAKYKGYTEYKSRVPAIIPGLKPKNPGTKK